MRTGLIFALTLVIAAVATTGIAQVNLHPVFDGVTVEVDGQTFRGTYYIAPMLKPDGSLYPMHQMQAAYIIVRDPKQVFVFDKRKAGRRSSARTQLFHPKATRTVADALRVDQNRWEVSGERLVFGQVKRGFSDEGGDWEFNAGPITFPEGILASGDVPDELRGVGGFARIIAQYTLQLRDNPTDKEILSKRAEAYRTVSDFEKALADHTKLGSPLIVRILPDEVSLMVGKKKVGTAARGEEVTVVRAQGDWLWVQKESENGEPLKGWVQAKQVR